MKPKDLNQGSLPWNRLWEVTYPPPDECMSLFCREKRIPEEPLCYFHKRLSRPK